MALRSCANCVGSFIAFGPVRGPFRLLKSMAMKGPTLERTNFRPEKTAQTPSKEPFGLKWAYWWSIHTRLIEIIIQVYTVDSSMRYVAGYASDALRSERLS